jgi:His-Xaa-Ser system protein HxsD
MIDGITPSTASPSIWDTAEGHLALSVDADLFTADAILHAAYKFTGTCHVWLEQDQLAQTKRRYLVFMRPKRQGMDLAVLAGDVSNELIDQQVRARLDQQFTDLRTIIAAQAFSEGNLLNVAANQK